LLLSFMWIMIIVLSFFWNYRQLIKEQERLALETGRSFFNQMIITRQWNARHGGIYVPVTEKTLPNPYLDVPMRDIDVNDNLTLTKVNPAFMTRQISEIDVEEKDIHFHITSLNPIRPQNKATKREAVALKDFEKGVKEAGMFTKEGSTISFFYMAPLKTEKPCLKCHAEQGYKLADIRGGISVTLPFAMEIPLRPLLSGHLLAGGVGLFIIIILGVKLNRAYEIIKRQALFDTLTEIPNRRSFSATVAREFSRSQRDREPLSIIMCDIDNFKAYNDTYGHSNGDICLKKVAQGIKNSLKRPGDFCARYGGEEFIVILSKTASDGAMHVAERIRSHIEEMGIIHEKSMPSRVVTLSLGVATSEDTIGLVFHEKLIQYADTALYKAKDQGRNQVQFSTEVA
ncbi:diguanylate cyclase, partial [Desulfobacula sp.]|uniref:diguanylate cyclase n=1 Tax=Desulfobacula sp. TaxID=2593537 RepID=UPI0025BB5FF2